MKFFTAFHINTRYSSIPSSLVLALVKNCYTPLLDLGEAGFKIGIEITGESLEEIAAVAPEWVHRFRSLLKKGAVELIGSSYSQAIFPLIPAPVNVCNLKVGLEIYKKYLGVVPRIAYVNEQTLSRGLIPLYDETGYKAIIMDWNNVMKATDADCHTYTTALLKEGDVTLPILWNHSIAFQKFQRYVRGEIMLDEYLGYLQSHESPNEKRSLCLYGSDVEIFGFRPWEAVGDQGILREWETMHALFEGLKASGHAFITPSEVLAKFSSKMIVPIGDAAYPIPTKKQDKYNLVRWAVTGRDDTRLNTACYKLYQLLQSKKPKGPAQIEKHKTAWKLLLKLWGSDFRTATGEDRSMEAYELIGRITEILGAPPLKWFEMPPAPSTRELSLRGGSPRRPTKQSQSSVKQEIASLTAFARNDTNTGYLTLKTPTVELVLQMSKGGAIRSATFPAIHKQPLFGTLPLGTFFDDISLSPDFYSGHIILTNDEGEQLCDLEHATIVKASSGKDAPPLVPPSEGGNQRGVVTLDIKTAFGLVQKIFVVSSKEPMFDVWYIIRLKPMRLRSLRLGTVTFFPTVLNKEALHYTTKNGGFVEEKFMLNNSPILHDMGVKANVSARHCLGESDGWLDVSDDRLGLTIFSHKDVCYSVPLIHYEPKPDALFLRVFQTISETDDTSIKMWRGVVVKRMSFEAHGMR